MDDQLRERSVESVVLEREILCRRDAHVDARVPLARSLDERLGRVGGRDRFGPSRRSSSASSAPGPQPTSTARWPVSTPARSASCADSWVEYRPMNLS